MWQSCPGSWRCSSWGDRERHSLLSSINSRPGGGGKGRPSASPVISTVIVLVVWLRVVMDTAAFSGRERTIWRLSRTSGRPSPSSSLSWAPWCSIVQSNLRLGVSLNMPLDRGSEVCPRSWASCTLSAWISTRTPSLRTTTSHSVSSTWSFRFSSSIKRPLQR